MKNKFKEGDLVVVVRLYSIKKDTSIINPGLFSTGIVRYIGKNRVMVRFYEIAGPHTYDDILLDCKDLMPLSKYTKNKKTIKILYGNK